tara:strand:- start:15191 stop:17251 length:2061 start_codon:yes stop_codon:yes gene_type:complete
MARKLGEIRVFTWPEQWQYWPMYIALARAQDSLRRRHNYKNLTFVLEIIKNKPTDQKIREYFKRYQKDHPAIALCEPPGLSDHLHDIELRKVPLVMRMPHWLIRSISSVTKDADQQTVITNLARDFNFAAIPFKIDDLRRFYKDEENDGKSTIYGFPKNTTSGDYTRKLVRWFERIGFPNFSTVDVSDLGGEAELVRDINTLAEEEALISYTPWHIVHNHVVAVAEYPGPLRDITALLVPESFSRTEPHDRQKVKDIYYDTNVIYREVHHQLNQALNELLETEGFDTLMRDLVEKNWVPKVKESKIASLDTFKIPNTWLALFLAHYVRRSCYFPYRFVLDSMGREIDRTVRFELINMQERTSEMVSRRLRNLFGSQQKWEQLSFNERMRCQNIWKSTTKEIAASTILSDRLKHIRDNISQKENKENNEFQYLVGEIRLDGQRGYKELKLIDLFDKEGLDLYCSIDDNQGKKTSSCPNQDCMICRLSGFPKRLLSEATTSLQESILSMNKFDTKNSPTLCDNWTDNYSPSLLCWEDVTGMVNVFKEELRNVDENENQAPCRVIHKRIDDRLNGNVLVGIFWRGSTEAHNGRGNASTRLIDWCIQRREMGNGPDWIGFGTTDPVIIARVEKDCLIKHRDWNLLTIEKDDDWGNKTQCEELKSIFQSVRDTEQYKFAYLAYYDFSQFNL